MRRLAVLLGSVLIAIGTAGALSVQTSLFPSPTGELVMSFDGCQDVGDDFSCDFTVTSDTSPIFGYFRWDFNGDGSWDLPVQEGPDLFSLFTIDHMATHLYVEHGLYPVCLQGWDGASVIPNGEEMEPDGPVVCANLVLGGDVSFLPTRINPKSQGQFVNVVFRMPDGVDADELDPNTVTLAGIPAVQATRLPSQGGGNNPDWSFKFDRGDVISELGPGTHQVILKGLWDDGEFFAAVWITIG